MPEATISVHDLVEDVSLAGISTLALSAERREETEPDKPIDPEYAMRFDVGKDEKLFRVVLDVRIETGLGNIRTAVAAEYALSTFAVTEVPVNAVEEFVNNVALMAVLPFVRQSIADLTQRVFDSALLMPMIARGQIEFSLGDDPW